ncbi:hypothetical protein LJ707_07190 [Mucilaginibacter sp. UR6-1]|uniref:hypothetical protein n=1 Tax=Mucilaginibacter sp. UR6-1 TaxID=1435643 RepID=UPI001E487B6D|nr:hypothetical protein [Mucilaginibacter sp. UR6-1]MCC8408707.1 hypothetical protein [Mucilaginibacter sp. UR6-1]
MKPIRLKHLFALFAPLIAGIGCVRNNCGNVACFTPAPAIVFELRDSIGRDLLNPATPNYYDTTRIKELNNGIVGIVPKGSGKNPSRIKLGFSTPFGGQTNLIVKLNSTDQDTIFAANIELKKDCCTSFETTAFKYNQQNFTDSLKSSYFVVVKKR